MPRNKRSVGSTQVFLAMIAGFLFAGWNVVSDAPRSHVVSNGQSNVSSTAVTGMTAATLTKNHSAMGVTLRIPMSVGRPEYVAVCTGQFAWLSLPKGRPVNFELPGGGQAAELVADAKRLCVTRQHLGDWQS